MHSAEDANAFVCGGDLASTEIVMPIAWTPPHQHPGPSDSVVAALSLSKVAELRTPSQRSEGDADGDNAVVMKTQRAKRRCSALGCPNLGLYLGKCTKHGVRRRCSLPGCPKQAKYKGKCAAHGGRRECSHPECSYQALARGKCGAHGGGTQCSEPGCTKRALSKGKCTAHGKRPHCSQSGCSRPVFTNGKCDEHVIGGRKCRLIDCPNPAKYMGLCFQHGYVECVLGGCRQVAEATSIFCFEHGGGQYNAQASAGRTPLRARVELQLINHDARGSKPALGLDLFELTRCSSSPPPSVVFVVMGDANAFVFGGGSASTEILMPIAWVQGPQRAGNYHKAGLGTSAAPIVLDDEPTAVETSDPEEAQAQELHSVAVQTTRAVTTVRRTASGKKCCSVPDCPQIALHGGKCIKHGGGKRCSHSDCNKLAKVGGKCIAHGGARTCSHADCTLRAVSRGKCYTHGGGSRCAAPGCPNAAQVRGKCRAHDVRPQCSREGCIRHAVLEDKCDYHSKVTECSHQGCSQRARFMGLCTAHGGYLRCVQEGCDAQAKAHSCYCRKHGGGQRCAEAGCTRRALIKGLCFPHSEGTTCSHPGCTPKVYLIGNVGPTTDENSKPVNARCSEHET